MKKSIIILLLASIILGGCEYRIGGEQFLQQIDQIELEIDDLNWEKIADQTAALEKAYKESKWKIQLLGDEYEYESLGERIDNLTAAIKEEDSANSRIILSSIRSILQDIYSL